MIPVDQQSIRRVLTKLGVQPEKSRGQNFLMDPQFAAEIVDFAGVSSRDFAIEVGAGLGALTDQLLGITNKVGVIEIQKQFAEYLQSELPDLKVWIGDVRRAELASIVPSFFTAEQPTSQNTVVLSNVPYSISTDIVVWAVGQRKSIRSATFLLQKQFAERLASGPGSRAYGMLSVLRERFADATLGPTVPPERFFPEPGVESRLIRLDFRQELETGDEKQFYTIVKAAFSARRKTLQNSLFGAGFGSDKKEVESALREIGIDPIRRAETLSVAEFASLANRFGPMVRRGTKPKPQEKPEETSL